MSADNRTVHTDALATLGTIITENEKRDAIHLAVIPVKASYILRAGEDVNAEGRRERPYVGIVDPFLKEPVMAGQWFWLVIYPRQINSLRHVWTHPAFHDEESKLSREEAEEKLRKICADWDGPSYDDFLQVATNDSYDNEDYNWSKDGEYLLGHGRDAHGEIPSEAWDLAEIITGTKIKNRPEYFSCSC